MFQKLHEFHPFNLAILKEQPEDKIGIQCDLNKLFKTHTTKHFLRVVERVSFEKRRYLLASFFRI